MQIRILLVLLCVIFVTPNDVYAKAGNSRHENRFGIDHIAISLGYRIDWKGGRR